MIKAVFFDFYNTLVRFDPPREDLQRQALSEFGIEVPREGLLRGYAAADRFWSQENARSAVQTRTPEEQLQVYSQYEKIILEQAGHEVSLELAGRIFGRLRQLNRGLALHDDVMPTLALLQPRGLTLGLLSNIHRDLEELCQKLGLSSYFNFLLTSQEVGAEKPHPPIFLAALEKAQVQPQEAMHVGDQYYSDVLGAQGVGIKAILLDRDGLEEAPTDCPRISRLPEIVRYL